MKRSLLYSPSLLCALETQGVLRPTSVRNQKGLFATLVLTPLVDAFSILVIYLMVNTTSGVETKVHQSIELPSSDFAKIIQIGTLVQLVGKNFLIEEEVVPEGQLLQRLKTLQQKLTATQDPRAKKLILQADRNQKFETINPFILSGTQAGFEEIIFAVVQNSEPGAFSGSEGTP